MTSTAPDHRTNVRRALDAAADAMDQLTDEQLSLSTPCAGWTLADLLRHMVAANERFAAAVRGDDPDAAAPLDEGELGDDPVASFRSSVTVADAAFAVDDVADHVVELTELPRPMPAPAAIAFHFTDSLVHGWDVARTLGRAFDPDPDLTAAALALAERIPDAARGPGAPFAPIHPTPNGANDFDVLLGLVGRDPGWTPPPS